MIIFGTRGVTTTPEQGEFFCPTCGTKRQYGLKRVRRFFTLFFIPLIPLDKLGEYVECTTCKDSYKPNVLNYDPEKQAQQFEADYHLAIKKVMIHVLLADGLIEDSEVQQAMGIYKEITTNELSESSFRIEILQIQNSMEKLSDYLINLQGQLNDISKERVINAAYQVAVADGKVDDDEMAMIEKIGQDIGMSAAHIKGVLSSV